MGARSLSHQTTSVCVRLVAQSYLTLCDAMYCSPLGSPSTEFSRQEYCSGLPFPYPGDPPHPGIEPTSPKSHALLEASLPSAPPDKVWTTREVLNS